MLGGIVHGAPQAGECCRRSERRETFHSDPRE